MSDDDSDYTDEVAESSVDGLPSIRAYKYGSIHNLSFGIFDKDEEVTLKTLKRRYYHDPQTSYSTEGHHVSTVLEMVSVRDTVRKYNVPSMEDMVVRLWENYVVHGDISLFLQQVTGSGYITLKQDVTTSDFTEAARRMEVADLECSHGVRGIEEQLRVSMGTATFDSAVAEVSTRENVSNEDALAIIFRNHPLRGDMTEKIRYIDRKRQKALKYLISLVEVTSLYRKKKKQSDLGLYSDTSIEEEIREAKPDNRSGLAIYLLCQSLEYADMQVFNDKRLTRIIDALVVPTNLESYTFQGGPQKRSVYDEFGILLYEMDVFPENPIPASYTFRPGSFDDWYRNLVNGFNTDFRAAADIAAQLDNDQTVTRAIIGAAPFIVKFLDKLCAAIIRLCVKQYRMDKAKVTQHVESISALNSFTYT